MLKAGRPSPAFRVSALLFSMAVAGGLIGYAWEDARYGSPPPSEDAVADEGTVIPRPPSGHVRTPGDEAVLARTLQHFPPYPNGSRPEALAADYLGPDAPIAVAWLSTPDTSDQVLEHYKKVLLDKGLPVLSLRLNSNAGYVGYWSPSNGEVRLVSTLHQGGETLIFVSAGEVGAAMQGRSKVPDWLPMPPGVAEPVVLPLQMEGVTYLSVSSRVPTGTLAEVEGAYRTVLRERGWEVGESSSAGFQSIGFDVSQPGARGQVLLRQPSPQEGVELNVSVTQR